MKGSILLKVLETIKNFSAHNADLFEAFLKAGYGASMGKMDFEFNKLQKQRRKYEIEKEQKKKYYDLLYRLRKDNLIEEKINSTQKFFILTEKGIKKLNKLKESIGDNKLSLLNYQKEIGDKSVIIIFDIPEKERKKRTWLRSVLQKIGMEMIQKSVWIGKVKIPKKFLEDLRELKLVDRVEIFEISKSGSLEKLI